VLKSSQVTSHVNVVLKTNISDIFSISIITVNVVNDHTSLMYILICQINASSHWHIMQQQGSQIVQSLIQL
jgi:hypothetical protein